MTVSVVVVAHNEEKVIERCLLSLVAQTYQPKEILIIDGCSTDSTADICQRIGQVHPIIRYLHNGDSRQTITKNRNIGLQNIHGEYIAFTDADCIAPPDWLAVLIAGFEKQTDPLVVGVGGTNTAPADAPPFVRAVAAVQASLLGFIGSSQGDRFRRDLPVVSLSCTNVLYRRSALQAIGGFREFLGNMGEDYDIGFRITRAGSKLIFLRQSFVWHYFRSSPGRFLKNMFAYGQGRVRLMRSLRDYQIKYVLPIIFLLVMTIAFLLSPFFPIVIFVPVGYIACIIVYSLFLSQKEKLSPMLVFLAFLCLHFGYSSGEIWQTFRP